MDRELTLAKCKLKLLYKRSWICGLKFPSSMHELAGTFKVKIKTAMPTGQLRLQKPANRASLFTSNFLFQSPSFAVATASSRTQKYNKNNIVKWNGRPRVTSVCSQIRHSDESGSRSGCKQQYCTMYSVLHIFF